MMDPSDLAEMAGLCLQDVPDTAEEFAQCFHGSAQGQAVRRALALPPPKAEWKEAEVRES